MGRPSDPQQVHQRLKLRLAQMAKLLQMAFTHRLIELLQQRQARVGNANVHHAAIVGNPLPGNEAALLQAIDESRDVGARDTSLPARTSVGSAAGCSAFKSRRALYCCAVKSCC